MEDASFEMLPEQDRKELCALAIEQVARLIVRDILEEEADGEEGGVLLQGLDEEG